MTNSSKHRMVSFLWYVILQISFLACPDLIQWNCFPLHDQQIWKPSVWLRLFFEESLRFDVLSRSLFFSVFCSKAYQTIFSQHNFWRNCCAWQALRGELFRMPPERVQQDSLVSFSWIQMKTFLKLEFHFGYAVKKVRVGLLELPVSRLLVLWSDFFILVNCWWLVSFI